MYAFKEFFMFTGLIQNLGEVTSHEFEEQTRSTLTVRPFKPLPHLSNGDSISVNGVCLTITNLKEDGSFSASVSAETLQRTTFSALAPGKILNLETPLQASSFLGGHLVQGHIDGIGKVLKM